MDYQNLKDYVYGTFDSVDDIPDSEKCQYAVAMYILNHFNTDFECVEDMIEIHYVEDYLVTLADELKPQVYEKSKYYYSFLK